MTYRTWFIVSALIGALSPLLAIAIDQTTSGRILDAFKREEYAILFENATLNHSGSTEVYEKEYILNGLEGLKKRLEGVTKVYIARKQETTEKKLSLEEAIANIDYHITQTAADIRKTEVSMTEKNTRITEYQDLATTLALRIQNNRSVLLSYIANLYTEGSLIYDEDNSIDIFQMLILSDGKTDDASRDILYKSLVSILGQKFIEEYRSLIKEYNIIQSRIRDEVALLEVDKELLDRQKKTLISQRDYKGMLLEATKGREALYEQYIKDQMRTQEQVEQSWKDAANDYTVSLQKLLEQNGCQKEKKTGADIERCGDILAFYRNERALKKLEVSTGSENIMDWPIGVGAHTLSTYFRDGGYYAALGSQHDAIDLVAAQGTDIYAPMDGYIQYILPPVSGGYSYMAVKHPGGYVTVYGHLSEVLVFPHQFVRKGDRIARTGGAPGTAGAGPMTSGAHLHFEVWKDREPIDPLRVLDISNLDYESLPSRYQEKFISDIIARVGYGADISAYDRKFMLKGESEESRQKYLLSTYASRAFQDHSLWVDAALDAHLDSSFLMCVGLAETTLGNYLKTPYNIGNVGNTDSGDTVTFGSAREGISWMAATFNNRYLSRYNSVSDLSRWGNPDGTIYASSNANWHNNIIRCISVLKGRFVEDRYPFRVVGQ